MPAKASWDLQWAVGDSYGHSYRILRYKLLCYMVLRYSGPFPRPESQLKAQHASTRAYRRAPTAMWPGSDVAEKVRPSELKRLAFRTRPLTSLS
eukprot:1523746-Pleurochrysis_carterae.AAC.1